MNNLIFNSEENYSQNLTVRIEVNGEDNFFNPQTVTIWNILNEFIQIDIYLNDTLDISSLELIQEIIQDKKINVFIFPDYTNQNTFFHFDLIKNDICENSKSINNECICFHLYCNINYELIFNNKSLYSYQGTYNEINNILLTDEEINYIDNICNKQYDSHWFNDQNILVESEYNKMLDEKNKIILKKQKKSEFDPSMLKVISGPLDPMETLNNITGLNNIKSEIKKLQATLLYRNKKNDNNKDITFENNLHMCFYGNPGTGKTTIARIMTGLLYEMGYIKENRCIEINGLELKGTNVGQTSVITKNIVDLAKGGILFIDEAYTLNDENEDNFGKEAINVFLKEMEDNRNDLILIFAGYRKPMDKLLECNSGFRSRIKKYFDFKDYNTLELTQILVSSLQNKHLYITKEALQQCMIIIKNAQKYKDFGNGRYIRNLIDVIEENHILNVQTCKDMNRFDTIELEDVSNISQI